VSLSNSFPILVTRGSGFIGASFMLYWMAIEGTSRVSLDKLTDATNPFALALVETHPGGNVALAEFCHGELSRLLSERHYFRAAAHFLWCRCMDLLLLNITGDQINTNSSRRAYAR
jgi:dTDP-D-glucose 4,6-dehydratase